MRTLSLITLTFDEYEAVRLVDFERLNQEQAAVHLGVSRPTCARIVSQARNKIATAIVTGAAIKISGGSVVIGARRYRCNRCDSEWEEPRNEELAPRICPRCESDGAIRVAGDPADQ